MIGEFKKFALRGNVVDMAVGVILGAAFGAIITSLVNDVLMPPVGMLFGKIDFANLYWVLQNGTPAGPYLSLTAAQEAGAVTLNYGVFINSVITFLIVALAMYLLIRSINQLKRAKPEAAPPEPITKECAYCFSEISIKAVRCPNCTSEL